MAFFDDLSKKITETSQGVVQKTKDTAESIKLNGLISDEQRIVNTKYAQIGKLYFELHADSYEQPFADMITAVKNSQAKIAQYSEQVKKIKGFVKCPNCGKDVPYGAPFCSSCGSKMNMADTDIPTTYNTVNRCTNCGMPIKNGCAFCTNCGAKVTVEQEAASASSAPASSAPVEAAPVEAAPVASAPAANSNLCINCGAEMGDNVFCTNCGTKRSSEAAPVQAEPVVQQPVKPTCQNCGTEIEEDSVFCINCGTKL